MTIALSFVCPEGMVLCTDSLDTDGYTKSRVNKIWAYETQDEWGVAVASAGESDFIDSFTENLRELFSGERFDKEWVMSTLRKAISAARTSYPDLEWAALFALFGPLLSDCRLLRVSHRSKHLAPVRRYEAFGVGAHLAKFLCSKLYTQFISLQEAEELAVFIVLQCINNVDGCDSPISLLSWKVGMSTWSMCPQNEIQKMVKRLEALDLRKNLLNYWREKTPHIGRRHKYDDLPQGGSVDFVRAVGKSKPKKE